MKPSELRELARLCAIQISFEDAAGKTRTASRGALTAVLSARLGGEANLGEVLAERRRAAATRFIEPVTVVWGRKPATIGLHLPRSVASVEYELTLESGAISSGRLAVSNEWEGHGFIGASAVLPEVLPFGYHTLRIGGHETAVFAAPPRAPAPRGRAWGIFAPLYAAHTARSWGAGDVGDLEAYRAWLGDIGGTVFATLPMLASFRDEPSPYSPVSRLFWNEMYLDVTRLPEYRDGDADAREIKELQRTPHIDHARVFDLKERVLRKLAERFQPDAGFEKFAEKARPYAEFMCRAGNPCSAGPTLHYHLYVQYRMSQQMHELENLYLDFPLGVNPNGFDAHHYAAHFAKGASVGAPPDLFFTKGQNWGFPPFDPDAIRERHHDYFRACVRHHVEHAGMLRIDHVMGLHRLFWIPQGGEPKDGVYVRYPENELYAVLLIEASRTGTAIVGEDLGTVPQYVPAMMKRRGLRRMYVVQYEMKAEGEEPAGRPAPQSVASVNTHDMPTFAGFWSGKDIDDRVEQGLLDERGACDERRKREQMRSGLANFLTARGLLTDSSGNTFAVLKALLGFLSASDAEVVLVNLEDLWLETEPQNVPGVPDRSWRRKLRYRLEELRSDRRVVDALRGVNDRRRTIDGKQE